MPQTVSTPHPAVPTSAPARSRNPSAGGPVDVTVCIANWNCRELLRDCLASLHDQPQGVRVETVVVDNGSADGAADMVARNFPEVVLVRNAANAGFSRANNQAARLARGRYLFFLNNDTAVPPFTLRRLLRYAEAHPEVGMVGPRLRDGTGRVQVSYRLRPTLAIMLHRTSLIRWTGLLRRAYRRYRRQQFDPDHTRQVEMLMGAAMFVRRDVFFRCGGWDEQFTFGGEDLALSAAVGRRHPLVFLPSAEITHYGRVSTRLHAGFASAHILIGFLKYLRGCGYSRPALWFYKTAVTLDAPVQLAGKLMQYLGRRLRGRREDATKSMISARGLAYFLANGLAEFWRA